MRGEGMDIFINTADKAAPLLQAKPCGTPFTSLRYKRGGDVPMTITLLGVKAASGVRVGVKQRDFFEAPLLAYAEAEQPSGTSPEGDPQFSIVLRVAGEEIDRLLAVGQGSDEPAPAIIPAETEICWQEDGMNRTSDSVPSVIANDIIRSSEPPQDGETAYPEPALVATKSWVNDLHAGPGQRGLVELEDGEPLGGTYTAVALTESGCIAVPAATSSLRGTVKLGTARKLPGDSVLLPVGERASDGGLAVDASGLSAYAVARKNGFEGTEEEWLASLKGEPGERGEQGPQGEPESMLREVVYGPGTSNAMWNYAVLAAGLIPPGKLQRIVIQARPSGNPQHAVYLGIMQQQDDNSRADASTWAFLGGSTNAVIQQNGQPGAWDFEDIEIAPGKPVALVGMAARDTGWNMATLVGCRGLHRAEGDTTSRMAASAVVDYIPELRAVVRQGLGQQLTDHEQDASRHVNAGEHAVLSAAAQGALWIPGSTGSVTLTGESGDGVAMSSADSLGRVEARPGGVTITAKRAPQWLDSGGTPAFFDIRTSKDLTATDTSISAMEARISALESADGGNGSGPSAKLVYFWDNMTNCTTPFPQEAMASLVQGCQDHNLQVAVIPVGDYAFLVIPYDKSAWTDNDFGLFVWGGFLDRYASIDCQARSLDIP